MPNPYNDDDNDDDTGQDQQQPNWRRKLEADAKAGREAIARAEAAEKAANDATRELAMRRAGVDPDSAVGALFMKGYDGAIDHDTLKAQWAAVNPAANAQAAADAAAMARISAAQAGGISSGSAVPDFEAELDAIPLMVDGQWNPEYQQRLMEATAKQAAREGREFVVSGGKISAQAGYSSPSAPAITPLSEG